MRISDWSSDVCSSDLLAHIREVDAITHVVRCFENDDVIHVNNKIDPIADIETIDTELALADLESVDKSIARYERVAKSGDKDAKARIEVLQKLRAALDEGRAARTVELDEDERALVRELFLLPLKPVMYVANVLADGFEDNPHLDAVRERAAAEGAAVVPVSAASEAEFSPLADRHLHTSLATNGLVGPDP